MKIIKQYLGETLFTIGVAITSFNIFNFSNHNGEINFPGTPDGYYYPNNILINISIGFVLITIGVFIIKNKKL